MTRLDIQAIVKTLRDELETRHKHGTVKMAAEDGTPVPTSVIQNEMFSLIYRLSKME
jgi:hypothetical protein